METTKITMATTAQMIEAVIYARNSIGVPLYTVRERKQRSRSVIQRCLRIGPRITAERILHVT